MRVFGRWTSESRGPSSGSLQSLNAVVHRFSTCSPEGMAVLRPYLPSGRQSCIASHKRSGRKCSITSIPAFREALLQSIHACSPPSSAASQPHIQSVKHCCIASLLALRESLLHSMHTCSPADCFIAYQPAVSHAVLHRGPTCILAG